MEITHVILSRFHFGSVYFLNLDLDMYYVYMLSLYICIPGELLWFHLISRRQIFAQKPQTIYSHGYNFAQLRFSNKTYGYMV
jgi:hypothetical protein